MNGHADPALSVADAPLEPTPDSDWMDLLTRASAPREDTKSLLDVLSPPYADSGIGWSLANAPWRATRVVYDAHLPGILLSHLKAHLANRPVPDAAKAAAGEWATHPHTDSARWTERLSALMDATVATVRSIEPLLSVSRNLSPVYVADTSRRPVLYAISEGASVMQRLAIEVISCAKRSESISWDAREARNQSENVCWRLADIMRDYRCPWLLLTGHAGGVLLRLIPNTDYISCSDLVADAPPNTLLPILASAILWQLSINSGEFKYPTNHSSTIGNAANLGKIPKEQTPPICSRKLHGPSSDLEHMNIELGFGRIGQRAVECYTLKRTSSRLNVKQKSKLVDIRTVLPDDDDENPNRTLHQPTSDGGKDKGPVAFVLATSKIGEGTCGTVYYGTYGTVQLAIKVANEYGYSRPERYTDECAAYEALRAKGLMGVHVPRFFGMFQMSGSILTRPRTVVITAYAGKAISSFYHLDIDERLAIYRAYKAVVLDARIEQGSFSPRNVVCDDHGVFRIIDFHRGKVNYSGGRSDLRSAANELALAVMHTKPLPVGGPGEAKDLEGSAVQTEKDKVLMEDKGQVYPEGHDVVSTSK